MVVVTDDDSGLRSTNPGMEEPPPEAEAAAVGLVFSVFSVDFLDENGEAMPPELLFGRWPRLLDSLRDSSFFTACGLDAPKMSCWLIIITRKFIFYT